MTRTLIQMRILLLYMQPLKFAAAFGDCRRELLKERITAAIFCRREYIICQQIFYSNQDSKT